MASHPGSLKVIDKASRSLSHLLEKSQDDLVNDICVTDRFDKNLDPCTKAEMMCYVLFGVYTLAIVVLGLLLTIFCVLKLRRRKEILGQSF